MAIRGAAQEVFAEELKKIDNTMLRMAIVEFFDSQVPDYFWSVPASMSGKHHAQFDAGEGGLVRHVQMTVAVCMEMLRLSEYEKADKDKAIAALLIHDSIKDGESGSHYHSDHPKLAAEKWMDFAQANTVLPHNDIETVFYSVLWHSGQWSGPSITSQYRKPKEYLQEIKLVHLCDYIASRSFFNRVCFR